MKSLILFTFLTLTIFFSDKIFSQYQVWHEQVSGVTATLTSVSAITSGNVWVCGYLGTVLRTTNAGINWINVTGNGIPTNVSLINIWGINANTALTAGYVGSNTWVWRTSNAGLNWTQVFSQPGGFINAIVFNDTSNNRGIMQGDPVGGRWSLWKTTNGGINWDSSGMYLPQSGSEAGWNNSMYTNGSKIWFGTNNTRIYYSNNFGQTWTWKSTAPEQNSYAICFDASWCPTWSSCSGLLGGANLMKSDDTGYTWTNLSSLGTGNFAGFAGHPAIVNSPMIFQSWYVRGDNKIYKSNEGGQGWFVEFTAPSGTYRHMARGRSYYTYMFAVRTLGGISACWCIVSKITPISSEIPKAYSLKQNYPNPFNSNTLIEFSIPEKTSVTLNIYNSSGQKVAELFKGEVNAGIYRAEWNAENVASGLYFYSMITENFTETKKMILVR